MNVLYLCPILLSSALVHCISPMSGVYFAFCREVSVSVFFSDSALLWCMLFNTYVIIVDLYCIKRCILGIDLIFNGKSASLEIVTILAFRSRVVIPETLGHVENQFLWKFIKILAFRSRVVILETLGHVLITFSLTLDRNLTCLFWEFSKSISLLNIVDPLLIKLSFDTWG